MCAMNMKYDMLCFSPVPPGLGDRNPRRTHTEETHDKSKRDETVQFMWCVDVVWVSLWAGVGWVDLVWFTKLTPSVKAK